MRDRPTHESLLAYVNGSLPADAAAEIEQLIAADEGLAVEIGELQLLANQGQTGADRLKAHQEAVRAAIHDVPASGNKSISPRIWMVAAAVCLLASIVVLRYLNSSSGIPDAGELLAWKEVPSLRSAETDTPLGAALEPGTRGEWKQVILALEAMVQTDSNRAEPQLFLGRALLLDGQQEAGILLLTTVMDNSNFLPKTRLDAQWYRALAHLYSRNCTAAKFDFEAISPQVGAARAKRIKKLLQSCS